MLTDRIIREINDQISRELGNARMAFDHAEKLECYERIAALKAALDPQPTRQQLLKELAESIVEAQNAKPVSHEFDATDLISDIAQMLRRR